MREMGELLDRERVVSAVRYAAARHGFPWIRQLVPFRHNVNAVLAITAENVHGEVVQRVARVSAVEDADPMLRGAKVVNQLPKDSPVARFVEEPTITDGMAVTLAEVMLEPSRVNLFEFGQALRQFHDEARNDPEIRKGLTSSDPLQPLNRVRRHLFEKFGADADVEMRTHLTLFEHAYQSVARAVDELLEQCDQTFVIHGDPWPGNLLVDPKTGRLLLHDFDTVGIGAKELDFAQVAHAIHARGWSVEDWDAFVAGYGEGAPSRESLAALSTMHSLRRIGTALRDGQVDHLTAEQIDDELRAIADRPNEPHTLAATLPQSPQWSASRTETHVPLGWSMN